MPNCFRHLHPLFSRSVAADCLSVGLALACAISAREWGFAAEPAAPAKAGLSLKVGFVPPPIEGTISLGVYDKSGKLVRTLRSEAQSEDFTIALNGYVVQWDGRDDAGKVVSAGKYRFLGYAVGDLGVTGEAYHGNDWVVGEEAPHLSRFFGLGMRKAAGSVAASLELVATDSQGVAWRVLYPRGSEGASELGEATFEKMEGDPQLVKGPASCAAKGGGKWSIETVLGETLVVQFDAQGEVARRLSIGAGEPVPVAVAAPEDREEVYLLEQDASGNRVRLRGLRRRAPAEPGGQPSAVLVWETFFEKNRWPADRFESARARLGRPKPFTPEKKVRVQLQPNPLLGDSTAVVDLMVSVHESGSFLNTADGLPLRKLTDTGGLVWAVAGSEAKATEITLLQSDGAVVEEYRVSHPSAMMSFDAGEYVWPPK